MGKLLLILAIVLILSAFSLSAIFKIKKIEITGGSNCLTEEIVLKDLKLLDKNLFLVFSNKLADKIKKQFVCVQDIVIEKKFPSKLLIKLREDNLVVKIAETNFFLPRMGYVAEGNLTQELPVFYLGKEINLTKGQKIEDQKIKFVIKLVEEIEKSDFSITSLRVISENEVAAYNKNGTIVVFSLAKDLVEQINSLQLALSKAKIDLAKIAKIDLRYDNPIVTNK